MRNCRVQSKSIYFEWWNVNGDVKARINGAGFDPLIAAGASKIGHDSRASMRAWL